MAVGTFQVSSLLFQLEAEDTGKPRQQPAAHTPSMFVHERAAALSTPSTAFAQRLLRDVRCFIKSLLYEAPDSPDADAVELASRLAAMGYSLAVRSALGGGSSCFRNLRHEFLVIRGTGDAEGVDHVVDLAFREQFSVSQASRGYQQLLESVPKCFVGPMGKLLPLVQLLCGEMAESFRVMGLTLPPWRRTTSMLSKWMPSRVKDTPFCDQGGSPPGGSPRADSSVVVSASAFQRFSADVYSTVEGTSPTGSRKDEDGCSVPDSLRRWPTVQIGFAV